MKMAPERLLLTLSGVYNKKDWVRMLPIQLKIVLTILSSKLEETANGTKYHGENL